MDFPKIFPATRVIALEENYRSTRPILSFANAITENFKERYAKTLFSSLESNQLPELVRPMDEEEQSAFVCERILQLSESGVPLSEIAVLFRSAWVSNELEVDLTARNIPFVKFGGLKFIEAAHIKDVLSILRIALNVSDMVAWHRTLLLLPGLGAKGAKNLVNKIAATQSYDVLAAKEFSSKKYCEELKKLHSLIKAFGSDQTNNSEEKIKEVINFYRPLMEANYDDSKKRMDDLVSFVHISSRYKDLIDFISAITLESPESSELEPSVSEKEHVVLSTIHSSKGLEWHTVFIISLVEGVLPSHYAVKKDENVEEERRLFYVAATRAKKNLYLISPEVAPARSFYSSYHSFSSESRFISEIPGLDELTARREMEDLDLGGPSEQDEDQSSSEKKNASQIKQRILQYFSKN
jgi:DNA helicase-2/ATP-dependent DNA helicase PcrA